MPPAPIYSKYRWDLAVSDFTAIEPAASVAITLGDFNALAT